MVIPDAFPARPRSRQAGADSQPISRPGPAGRSPIRYRCRLALRSCKSSGPTPWHPRRQRRTLTVLHPETPSGLSPDGSKPSGAPWGRPHRSQSAWLPRRVPPASARAPATPPLPLVHARPRSTQALPMKNMAFHTRQPWTQGLWPLDKSAPDRAIRRGRQARNGARYQPAGSGLTLVGRHQAD
jgi:hypothetical protein